MKTTNKEVFSIQGSFKQVEEFRRAFVPDSPAYYRDRSNHQPLNKKYTVTFSTKIPTRSEQQLAYHWVLMSYLSEHTGFTPDECHQLIKQLVWGTETIKIGKYSAQVCKSISDKAMRPKYEVVALIEKDLEICAENEIRVPTRKELGYVDENEKIEPITNYPEDIGTPTF